MDFTYNYHHAVLTGPAFSMRRRCGLSATWLRHLSAAIFGRPALVDNFNGSGYFVGAQMKRCYHNGSGVEERYSETLHK